MKKLLTGATLGAVLVLAVALPASAQYKHPKMHHWVVAEGGGASINAMTADEQTIVNDGNANNDPAVVADCQTFRDDVGIAQTLPPIPDKPVQRQWSAALNDYYQAATLCVAGFGNNDANGEIEQATSDFGAGTALIVHLTKEL
jgi:hypothetical protein